MKKFRIVGLLLVLCLITSSFVGVTFAKYISTATGNDTAVVAKWEITYNDLVNSTSTDITDTATFSFDLFNTIGDTNTPKVDDVDVANAANPNPMIIAPGTSGSFEFSIVNASEVSAKYTIALTETNTGNIPLQYSVDGSTWKDSIAELVMDDLTDQAIAMGGTATKTVHWRWVFDNVATPIGHAGQTDVTDTALGVAAQSTAPTVTITATITATQLD